MGKLDKAMINQLSIKRDTERSEGWDFLTPLTKAEKTRYIMHHLIHPDYVLFDWEFFSNELEFE
ncbi:hypothetical protein [Parafilimonas terrae]|uniref:Uncharacterized protein n=1 Tax=Parafilimonas terrae TaxID=1465490 RepID=A0A1I5XKX8_9BACT|nr:hypothetical protein [Parafilimonas terrae]SFQ32621.1 hypothetical protein SAMN05444277_10920 [Parafilimonas terrae]